MEKPDRGPFVEFFRNSHPLGLLAGLLLYALGAGIVVYRGQRLDWSIYWLGQGCVIMLQLSSSYLLEFYDRLQAAPPRREGTPNNQRSQQAVRAARNVYLLAGITTLTIGAMLTVLLAANHVLSPASYVILGLGFFFAFFYSVPPLRLARTGYGEVVAAVLLTNLTPAFAYLLQDSEFMNVLGVITLPLTILFLAMTLATSLETYYQEIKAGRQNLMIRLGWQGGMFLHNLCILVAYLTMGLTTVFGLPWSLSWPRLLTLPVGLFQVWQIWRIGNGAKPQWRLLRVTAYATFAITVYLQAFTMWVH